MTQYKSIQFIRLDESSENINPLMNYKYIYWCPSSLQILTKAALEQDEWALPD